jgi:hypothetical protein
LEPIVLLFSLDFCSSWLGEFHGYVVGIANMIG